MTDHATETTPEPEPPAETTTTAALEVAAEIHARIELALAALSDAAELAAESAALPGAIAGTVLRALSHAHRYVSDAYTLTTVQAVGAAHLVQMTTPADASRRVLCTCGLSFTPAGWQLHRAGHETEGEHQLAGQLVAAGPRWRREAVELLLSESEAPGRSDAERPGRGG